MLLFFIAAIWNTYQLAPGSRFFRAFFKKWWDNHELLALSLLFFVPLASGLWSDNTASWASQIRVRLPFLLLPLAFANMPTLSKKQLSSILYLGIWVMLVLCTWVTINFFIFYEEIIGNLAHGRPVPVPRNHIRFSLLIATYISCGFWLLQQKFFWLFNREKWLLGITLLGFFLLIHLLSVRSAIAALYACLIYSAAFLLLKMKNRLLGLGSFAIIAASPFIAYTTMPSLQNRIAYMVRDWQQYRENKGYDYSDAHRWISLEVGWQIWKENPILGVGAGDLQDEVAKFTQEKFPSYSQIPRLPHNQFIYMLSSTGLVGLLLSLFAFLYPLALQKNRRFYLFSAFQCICLVSFLVEYTVETALGVAFYLFFTLWTIKLADISNAEQPHRT